MRLAVAGLGATDVGATQCGASADPSGPFQAVPTPTSLSGAPLPVPGAVELHGTAVFKTGAPVFVEVIDANANTDPAVRETILVALTTDTGDAETLRLLETSADSSTFAGYVDSVSGPAVAHDCAISGGLHVTLTADYVDAADAADHAVARAMLDPVSRVFVASTGQAVDGASIVLLDGNGAPAHVSGDDGTSPYPAAVASGTDVVDAGGAHYAYAHGEYRFPWLAPGTYQLRVTPPHRFAFPSAASDAAIQSVAGAPYALSDASRGATFTIAVGPSSRVDLPLDLLPITPTRAAISTFAIAAGKPGAVTQAVAATQCANGASFVAAPAPVSRAGAIAVPGPVGLLSSGVFGVGEPVFVVLTDPDQDLDPFAPDTVLVTAHSPNGDTQSLRLSETGASTGVFSGYLQLTHGAAIAADCALSVAAGAQLTIAYQDASDQTDAVTATAVVDPGSRVFNSATGDAVDGISITLLDAVTGQPADGKVFSEDGATAFPTTVVSGAGATDSAGVQIPFASGTYRFPVVLPGTYRLRITPPPAYAFPSGVADAQLQTLTGAPFALSTASRGADFIVAAGEPVQVDVPVDPTTVDVFVSKQANKDVAAVGDFVQYQVLIQNADTAGIVTNGSLIDQLPKGFRYVANSVRINGARTARADHREERYDADVRAAGSRGGDHGRSGVRDRNQRRCGDRQGRERGARHRRGRRQFEHGVGHRYGAGRPVCDQSHPDRPGDRRRLRRAGVRRGWPVCAFCSRTARTWSPISTASTTSRASSPARTSCSSTSQRCRKRMK